MKRIDRLILEAKQAAKFRGHDLFSFTHVKDVPRLANSVCRKCGAYVGVNAKPQPNEIDIGGEAVAVNCPDRLTSLMS